MGCLDRQANAWTIGADHKRSGRTGQLESEAKPGAGHKIVRLKTQPNRVSEAIFPCSVCAIAHQAGKIGRIFYTRTRTYWRYIMRNADVFKSTADAGFIREIDPEAARHQLKMSLGLIAVLTFGLLATGLTARNAPRSPSSEPAHLTVQAPQLVHVQQAGRISARQPGG